MILYDPKWGTKVKQNENLIGFIAWLEKQNPETVYNYAFPDRCALAQYLKSQGKPYMLYSNEADEWVGGNDRILELGPQTFGALLARAKAAL